jgi:hypothetical protein
MTSILDPSLPAVTGPAPDGSGLPQPPVFSLVEAERKYRKEQLAAGQFSPTARLLSAELFHR